jgi:hypothetical protein
MYFKAQQISKILEQTQRIRIMFMMNSNTDLKQGLAAFRGTETLTSHVIKSKK